MLQLNIIRQLSLHKTLLTVPFTTKQQKSLRLSRCAVFRQNAKTTASAAKEGKFLQEFRDTGPADISTDVRPLGERIKENTKTASYMAVVLAGFGVAGVTLWAICRELFSSSSPSGIYSNALERVRNDPRVRDSLGTPIRGFGEESHRGRRQHVAHALYDRNGVTHMRMQFYVKGLRNRATVYLEARPNALTGKQEYRYLLVRLDYYPYTTIVLEDKRVHETELPSAQAESNGQRLELTAYRK